MIISKLKIDFLFSINHRIILYNGNNENKYGKSIQTQTATLNRKRIEMATLLRNENTYGSVRTDPGKKKY